MSAKITQFTKTFAELDINQRLLLTALVLFILSFVQYAYTLGNPFIWDSITDIVEDKSIRSPANIPSFFISGIEHSTELENDKLKSLTYYRPLVKTLQTIEYAFFGVNPLGYHLVSVLLNAIVVVSFFYLVNAITAHFGLAFAASALYAVNPPRGEAVYWVYSVSYILVAFFSILALHLYHKRLYLFSVIAFIFALLSSEFAIFFPIILLIYEYFIRHDKSLQRYWNTAPYWGLVLIYLFARSIIVGSTPPLTDVPPLVLFNTIAVIIQRILKIFLLPDGLVVQYPDVLFEEISAEVVISFLVVASAIALGFFLWRKDRSLMFWYLWFFVWISITFNVAATSGNYLFGEKILYLASAGLCVVATSLILRLRFGILLLIVVIPFHFTITFVRSTYWKDPIIFYETLIRSSSEFPMAHYHLGLEYAKRKNYRTAVTHFKQVVAMVPGHSISLNNLGNCYYILGNRAEAVSMWSQALSADPGNVIAAFNLGIVAEQDGNLVQALHYYRLYLHGSKEVSPQILHRIRSLENRVDSIVTPGHSSGETE